MNEIEQKIRNEEWFCEKIKILTMEGYADRFFEYVNQGYTRQAAYEKTEKERVEFFGVAGYASYDSFIHSLNKKTRNASSRHFSKQD